MPSEPPETWHRRSTGPPVGEGVGELDVAVIRCAEEYAASGRVDRIADQAAVGQHAGAEEDVDAHPSLEDVATGGQVLLHDGVVGAVTSWQAAVGIDCYEVDILRGTIGALGSGRALESGSALWTGLTLRADLTSLGPLQRSL